MPVDRGCRPVCHAQQHRTGEREVQRLADGVFDVGRRVPVVAWDQPVDVFRARPRVVEERCEQTGRFVTAGRAARGHQRCHESRAGVEGAEAEPAGVGECEVDDGIDARVRHAQLSQALPQRHEKLVGPRPGAPVFGGHGGLVTEDFFCKARGAHPAPADRGVHDLQPSADAAPHDDEVHRAAHAVPHDDDRGQR